VASPLANILCVSGAVSYAINFSNAIKALFSSFPYILMKAGNDEVCKNHWQFPADFICMSCGEKFCRACVKIIGSASGAICSVCGELCLPFAEVKQQRLLLADQQTPFGFDDFRFALRYPFKEPVTVLGLGMIYGAGLFSLPFYLLAEVGILISMTGFLPIFLSNAMMFGCACLIIKRLETGRTDSNDVFDMVALLAEIWSVLRVGAAILLTIALPFIFSLQFGIASSLFQYIAFGWMIFYYPVALLAAAISQSFWSTINPLVGLNAVVRLGAVYFKLLAMYLLLFAVVVVLMAILAKSILPTGVNLLTIIIFAIAGIFIAPPFFYANMVLASMLGRVLFKYGDRI
jgi:hypothetical protein